MSDKHFIGLDLTGLEDNGLRPAISRVTLLLDDEHAVTAGDDTGAEIKADCPHATQAVAEAILAQAQGYQYRMFSATDAALDPAAELGDGVTVGGMYSVLARVSEDGSGCCGITAPGEAELEDEFPTGGFLTKEFNLKITQVRSSIKKTATEITQLVEDTATGLSGEFSVQLERIAGTVTGLDGRVSTVEQTAERITQRIESAEGFIETALDPENGWVVTDSSGSTKIKGSSIDTDTLNLTGAIKFTDLNADAQGKINSAASNASAALTNASVASSNASSALTAANTAKNTVTNWTYGNTTYIDGNKIMADTVTASRLQGGTVQLLVNADNGYGTMVPVVAGTFEISTAGAIGDRRGALHINSDAIVLQTSHRDGMLNLINANGVSPTALLLDPAGSISVQGNLRPVQDSQYNLGFSNFRWNIICLQSAPLVTSDRTKKEALNYDLDCYNAFFDALRPASFRFVDGQSGRTHLGMVSQDIEEELEATGLTDMDFAGFIRSPRRDEKGNEIEGELDYMLRYEEFIPLCVDQIQKLKARVAVLEGRLAQ